MAESSLQSKSIPRVRELQKRDETISSFGQIPNSPSFVLFWPSLSTSGCVERMDMANSYSHQHL